jgi:hypothetical protein
MRITAAALLVLTASALPQTATVPKSGSAVRKAILDSLRKPVEKDLGQKVVFQIDTIRVAGNWAFVSGKPRSASGKSIDYRKTSYRDAVDSGAFDDWICALFKKQGKQWKVLRYAIGATDVVWDGWDKEFKAPRAIFPYGT